MDRKIKFQDFFVTFTKQDVLFTWNTIVLIPIFITLFALVHSCTSEGSLPLSVWHKHNFLLLRLRKPPGQTFRSKEEKNLSMSVGIQHGHITHKSNFVIFVSFYQSESLTDYKQNLHVDPEVLSVLVRANDTRKDSQK